MEEGKLTEAEIMYLEILNDELKKQGLDSVPESIDNIEENDK